MNLFRLHLGLLPAAGICLFISFAACKKDETTDRSGLDAAVLLVLDEESIDNGNPPNNFSEVDVNDQLAEVGLREQLLFFKENIGDTIDLFTGEVGDEGWHALKTIPNSWIFAGPSSNGSQNYLLAWAGFEEDKLDKTPDVTSLRATGLKMLIGKTVLAVVYDNEVSINYAPLNGNLMGANLGLVAFDVLKVTERTDGSSSSLPRVKIAIRDVAGTNLTPLLLFANAPVPQSSSEPFDITPPNTVSAPQFVLAP